LQDVYPQLSRALPLPAGALRRKIAKSLGQKVHVMCSGHRMGDHVLATYACAGLSRNGVEVVFHTPHAEWLKRVCEPGLTITKKESKTAIDLNWAYASQLRYGQSRAAWYAASLHPMLKPAKPVVDMSGATARLPFERYIVLAPYTELKDLNNNQNWPETHWTRLANLLRKDGYELIAIGSPSQSATLLKTFSQTPVYWAVGHTPEWNIDVLLGAKALIGVDTDLTQMAALFQIRSVAIHSQLPGSFLWPNSTVRSVTPATTCTFCRWQEERGYLVSCSSGCSALATVSPETVQVAIRSMLNTA
jgi:ADP-heptose:LPS heptosyltransferase